jgi:GR25 family glycosyltransferase involved in LPS biosynthesis
VLATCHRNTRGLDCDQAEPREIGCWISHRCAMQRLVDSGDAMATILEDDAKLLQGFSEVLATVEKRGAAFDFVDLHRLFKKGEIFRRAARFSPISHWDGWA